MPAQASFRFLRFVNLVEDPLQSCGIPYFGRGSLDYFSCQSEFRHRLAPIAYGLRFAAPTVSSKNSAFLTFVRTIEVLYYLAIWKYLRQYNKGFQVSIIQEIQKWSEGLPGWQQDAVARLYAKRELPQDDLDDLYALLKIEHGIADPNGRVPGKLAPDQVAVIQSNDQLIQITSIKNLRNVNAIAEGQSLPISEKGLTVIYGENGAGKSGYSRVLKKACRARDKSESILPNANKERGKSGPAQASFDILVDGVAETLEWIDGKPSPEQLSALAIFDSHCARAYVDNHGDFAYAPYGLDIIEGLVKTCNKLKEMAAKEQSLNKVNLDPFESLRKVTTAVGKLLISLSLNTKPADVGSLATLSEAEKERLTTLTATIAEADPKQKALALRNRATRFANLAKRIGEAANHLGDAEVNELKSLIEKSNAAKKLAELAAKKFRETPGLLPGTGDESWRQLFAAARAFAVESHPAEHFPHLDGKSACPLCQNPLGASGAARMVAFDTFIQQEAEKAFLSARQVAVAAYETIKASNLELALDEPLLNEMETALPGMGNACAAMQKALNARRAAILQASKPNGDWDAIVHFPTNPSGDLTTNSERLMEEAKTLESSMDAKAKAAMVEEHAGLDARVKFAALKGLVLDAIRKFALSAKLQACQNACTTTSISKKSTELAKSLATPEVEAALNTELTSLNVHELRIAMKNESPKGKTQFKLVLELPGGGSPADILSEGEQRAIAIASFLAEINLGKGKGGIVFDDPVSSLDHRRRWNVAKRLALEATRRQVIVLTHDIYFLCILQQEADQVGFTALSQCIRKTPAGFGVQTERLPFDTLSTSKRVKALRKMHANIVVAHKANDEDEVRRLTRDAYYHLRLGWERGVEEVLFQGAVTRFGEGISTQKLRNVEVSDADYAQVDVGMTKSSKFAHDPAAAVQLPTPHHDDLSADIEALESWRDSVEKRSKVVEIRRK